MCSYESMLECVKKICVKKICVMRICVKKISVKNTKKIKKTNSERNKEI